MTLTQALPLVTAGLGLVVGLAPFVYTVFRDRQNRRDRIKREAEQREQEREQQAKREDAEREREREVQRERRKYVATRYLDLLGQAMFLLETLRADADNADELMEGAKDVLQQLQGHAQGELLVNFGPSSPVIWADRACRRLLNKGWTMAQAARSEHQTGDAARATQNAIRELTLGMDPVAGPRELFRWATDQAISRWPELLTRFEGGMQYAAQQVAARADLELPPELIAPNE